MDKIAVKNKKDKIFNLFASIREIRAK